jgi:hypothetical protein
MHEGGVVYAVVDDDTMAKILAFDVKRKQHSEQIVGSFEYVHPEDRRNYALSLLGLTQDPIEPITGDNVIVVFRNRMVELPEKFSKCKRMYIL